MDLNANYVMIYAWKKSGNFPIIISKPYEGNKKQTHTTGL